MVHFGVFEVDLRTAELRKQGVRIRLSGQSFQVLEALLLHPGELVTREELQRKLWPSDSFGDFEHGLNAAVNRVREALGDSSDNPRFIETLPRRGYRFIASLNGVSQSEAADLLDSSMPIATQPLRPSVSVRVVAAPPRQKSRIWMIAVATVVLLCAIVAGWVIWRSISRGHPSTIPAMSSNRRVVPLTDLGGSAWGAVLSPDAKLFAFFWSGENPQKSDLYVQLVRGEKPLRLTDTGSEYICCATWSPDGREIAFARCNNADNNLGEILSIPALGGMERKLTDVACLSAWPTWTSDGRSLIMADRCTPKGPGGIVQFSLQTGEKLCLTKPPSDDLVDSYPALSPNQKTVAFARCNAANATKCDIYTVVVGGGNLQRLTTENNIITDLVWSADGKFISFGSNRTGVGGSWRVAAGGGAIEPETVNPELGAISRDGRHAIYVDGSATSSIWRADLSDAGGPALSSKQMVSGSYPDSNVQLSSL